MNPIFLDDSHERYCTKNDENALYLSKHPYIQKKIVLKVPIQECSMAKEYFNSRYLDLDKPEFKLNIAIGMRIKINSFSIINTPYSNLESVIYMPWIRKMNEYISNFSTRQAFIITSYIQKKWVKYPYFYQALDLLETSINYETFSNMTKSKILIKKAKKKYIEEIDEIINKAPAIEKQMILYQKEKSNLAYLDIPSDSKKIKRIKVKPGIKCLMVTNFTNDLNNLCFIFASTLEFNTTESKKILKDSNSICPNLVDKIILTDATATP
jgi:hypothetical protein